MRLTEEELQRIINTEGYSVVGEKIHRSDDSSFLITQTEKSEVPKEPSSLEKKFIAFWNLIEGDGGYTRNFRFDLPDSRMELDFAWPELKIAIEINGGQSLGKQSGHGNWNGLERDAVKQNQCIYKGWTLFWVTTSMMNKQHLSPIAQYIATIRKGHDLYASE